jgi:hypothetical protein
MWTIVLFTGIILLVVGAIKRKTDWGKPVAVLGVVAVGVSLFVAGPDMLDSAQRGYQQGYEDAQNGDVLDQNP